MAGGEVGVKPGDTVFLVGVAKMSNQLSWRSLTLREQDKEGDLRFRESVSGIEAGLVLTTPTPSTHDAPLMSIRGPVVSDVEKNLRLIGFFRAMYKKDPLQALLHQHGGEEAPPTRMPEHDYILVNNHFVTPLVSALATSSAQQRVAEQELTLPTLEAFFDTLELRNAETYHIPDAWTARISEHARAASTATAKVPQFLRANKIVRDGAAEKAGLQTDDVVLLVGDR